MAKSSAFKPGDGRFKFKTKLEGVPGYEASIVRPPFHRPTIFGTRARVPIQGTFNGHQFRSSLSKRRDGFFFVVNKAMRDATKAKGGDTAEVVIERDREKRVVTVPAPIKKVIASNKAAQKTW